jgi:diguanylate cyclase (GGDEF)-like protein
VLGQKELKYLAYHDKLTSLRNRDAFYEQLDRIIYDLPRDSEKKITAVLFCDLDSFKLVNDSLGHDIGDLVLKEVSTRFAKLLRKSDHVFRLGGDEFTIITRHLNSIFDAGKIAEKIIKSLAKPYHIKDYHITYLTVSIGIVILPKAGPNRDEMIKNADTAMYHAKKNGKNQYQFFSQQMTEESVNRLKIENNLQTLVSDNSFERECEIHYQPIIENQTKNEYKVIGVEALIRWSSPELGWVLPDKFIPIAEETNLISPMGDWIFYKTCSDMHPFIQENKLFYVSINLSAIQLKSSRIVEKFKTIIETIGIRPQNIQLELTETSFLDEKYQVVQNIESLRNLGMRLAIDDFGIGFASLVYLQKIPASTIKIDRSFIKQVGSNSENERLLISIIQLGKNMQKEVVAEGVENPEQLNFLKKNKCFKYQGYLFGKPMKLESLESFLSKEIPNNPIQTV